MNKTADNHDNNVAKPHDSFWRKMMQHKKTAQEFFEMHLPEEIKREVQLKSLQLQSDSFIERNLRTQTTDLLYSVKFKQQAGYIYTLIEHQSKPDKSMPFRLLKYIVAIMDRHLKQNKGSCLPVIYPLIVYTGATPYNHSTDLYDLFGEQKALAKNTFLQPYRLINYREIKDQDLERFLYHGMVVKTMRHIYDADFLLSLQNIIVPHLKVIANLGEKDYIYDILHYIFYIGSIEDEQAFVEIVQKYLTQEFGEHVMTLAERLEQRGIQRGMQQGVQQGMRQGVQKAAIAIAKNLLQQGMSIEQVALATGLSEPEVKTLKN